VSRFALNLLLLACATLCANAQDRWAVVVDRSGSMRWGDPEGRGLEALGLALVLAADADAVVEVYDAEVTSFSLTDGPGRLLEHLATLVPRPGGEDLVERLERARAGEGRVLLYTDDALDVVDTQGNVPERWLRAAGDASTRDAVNAAAHQALASSSGAPVLALRAPLPDAARATPFLETALNAEVVDLERDAPQRAVTRLASLLAGKPVMEALRLDSPRTRLAPGFPARALVRAQRPIDPGGRKLDRRGTLWLVEVPADGLELGEHGGAVCYLAPNGSLPADLAAFGLDGVVRVEAGAAPPGGTLVLRADGAQFPLTGTPPRVDAPLSGKDQVEVVLQVGESAFVADSRRVEVLPVVLSLTAEGEAQVGQPLLLRGALPAGFTPSEPLQLQLRCGAGEAQDLRLDADLTASYTPTAVGRLSASVRGPIPLEFKAPVIAPLPVGPRLRLLVKRNGETTSPGELVPLEGSDELEVQVEIRAEPPYSAPVAGSFSLEGGEGVTLVAEPFEVADTATATVRLRWPGDPGKQVGVTLLASTHGATPATGRHTLRLLRPVDLLRRYIGLALILLAVIAVGAYFLQRRFRAYMAQRMGHRQLRGIDAEGKISVERYEFLGHSREDEVVEISPELTQSSVELIVEDDGSVRASISGRAKLIHESDPTKLLDSVPLEHGDSFAMVEEGRARRFVYLEDDPTGEELERHVASDRVSAQAELRDSGVYVLLDEHQNVAPVASVIDAGSEELFPSAEELNPIPIPLPPGLAGLEGDEIEDSVDEMAFVPVTDDGPMVSDEGVVFLGSDEAEILDSDEAATIDADTDISDMPQGA